MQTKKEFTFKGLNLRDSVINIAPEYASDVENVLLNSKRELIKRHGYDSVFTPSGYTITDCMEYANGTKLIIVASDGNLYRLDGSVFTIIRFGGDAPSTAWDIVDYDEYNNVLYFTDVNGNNDLYKYDGYMVYRAGIPKMSATTATPAGLFYYRLVYVFTDLQGNKHWGDYQQFDLKASSITFTVDTFNGTEFYKKGGVLNGGPSQTINSGNLTIINITSGHNYGVGDFIRTIDTSSVFRVLEIASATPTTITLTSDSVGSNSFSYGPTDHIEERTLVGLFSSLNKTYGYTEDLLMGNPALMVLNGSAATSSISNFTPSFEPMQDVYDTTELKGLPPKSKYFKIFGETSVLGAKINTQSSSNDFTDYSESQIAWSDLTRGSSVETFTPFAIQNIGRTSEGAIKGLFSNETTLTIMKESQIYNISGILTDRAFRLTSSLSAGIGCLSHKSIVEVDGGCLFQSVRGIYFIGRSAKVVEISDLIEPLFTEDTTGLDLTKTVAVRDTIKERVLFFIPATLPADSIVLVFDYYHKEWFKFKNYDASNGLIVVDDVIHHSDGTKLYKANSLYTDDGDTVTAFYKTSYHHLGLPGIQKKFVKAILFSIGELNWTCGLTTQKNWKNVDDTDVEIAFTPELDVEDKSINMSNCRSMALTIKSSEARAILINGYEIEYEINQRLVKGDS